MVRENLYVDARIVKNEVDEFYLMGFQFDYRNPSKNCEIREFKGKISIYSKIIENLIPEMISKLEKILGRKKAIDFLRIEKISPCDMDEIEELLIQIRDKHQSGQIIEYTFLGVEDCRK